MPLQRLCRRIHVRRRSLVMERSAVALDDALARDRQARHDGLETEPNQYRRPRTTKCILVPIDIQRTLTEKRLYTVVQLTNNSRGALFALSAKKPARDLTIRTSDLIVIGRISARSVWTFSLGVGPRPVPMIGEVR